MTKVVDDLVECKCGKIYQLYPDGNISGCCWINCSCGKTICKTCGSERIEEMERTSDEDYLWCSRHCLTCNTVGCGECI